MPDDDRSRDGLRRYSEEDYNDNNEEEEDERSCRGKHAAIGVDFYSCWLPELLLLEWSVQ